MSTQLSLDIDVSVATTAQRSLFHDTSMLESGAILSPCGIYRYQLRRGHAPFMGFVMLNPSTADAEQDDPTIRRCVGFAASHGLHGILVVNLFAYRATDPEDLALAAKGGIDIIGPENDQHVVDVVRSSDLVVVAWGAAMGTTKANRHSLDGQVEKVLELIRDVGKTPHCLGLSAGGHPRHPLMLPVDARATPFEVAR